MTGLAPLLAVLVVALVAWRARPAPRRVARLLARSPAPVAGDRRRRQRRDGHRHIGRVTVVLTGLVTLVLWPPGLVLVAVGWLAAPRVRAARRRRADRRAVATGLPDALDLLVLAIGTGQTVVQAVADMARLALPPFGPAFAEVHRKTERGHRLADALLALPERLGPPVQSLTAALVATDRYGVPIGRTLDQLALDARRERARRAELAARKLPVRLSFPLVCCILPAFGLLTLAPLLAGALGSLRL